MKFYRIMAQHQTVAMKTKSTWVYPIDPAWFLIGKQQPSKRLVVKCRRRPSSRDRYCRAATGKIDIAGREPCAHRCARARIIR